MSHPPSASRAYRSIARIIRPVLRLLMSRTWRGAENLPSGGFIAAGNHVSALDPLTFAHYLYDNGRPPRIMAKASLFTAPVLGRVMRNTAQIPVNRSSAAAGQSLSIAASRLADGDCVAVFPEGTLTRDPDLWPMAAKTGVARLALTSGAPVIPIAQWGAHTVLPRYAKFPHLFPRKHVTVVAGPPVDLSDLMADPGDAAALREATRRVMAAISSQLGEIRGETPPVEPFDMRQASA